METLGILVMLLPIAFIMVRISEKLNDILEELKKLNTHKSTEEIKGIAQEIIDKTNEDEMDCNMTKTE